MSEKQIFICPYRKSNGGEAAIMVESLRRLYLFEHEVIFIGDDPKITGTTHIPFKSVGRSKETRVAEMLTAAIHEIEYEPFILTNDDIFAIKPINEPLPLYYSGFISEQVARYNPANIYRKTLQNSIQRENDLNFAVHYPMPIHDPYLFERALQNVIRLRYASFRNLYGNMFVEKHKKAKDFLHQTKDCKLFSRGGPERIQQVYAYSSWLSVGDGWFTYENKKAVIKHIQNE